MKCEDFGKYLDNYESLNDAEKTEMTDHAAMCEKCREELDFFLAMLAAAKSLPPIEPPADFMDTLNARLDAEDKKPSPNKIIYHVRRNWKQYTSLAACLALVAVITANRGILLDRIEGNEDGVITEETVSDGDNTAPDGTHETVTAADTAAQEQEAASENNTPAASAQLPATPAAATAAATATAVTSPAVRQSSPSKTTAPVTRAAATNETAAVSAPANTTETAANETTTEPVTTASAEPARTRKSSGDYGIALKGAVMSAEETASVDYDLKPEEVSASLRASKIIDSYSIADGGESIALGAYYSIDKNGRPIMTVDENAIKAVGSLKISSDDAEKAMEILSQYPHDEAGNVYTTGSENVDEILSELSDEDITYTNYIVGGSDDVKFRVEFN